MLHFEPGLAIWAIITFILLLVALYFTAWPAIFSMIEKRDKKIKQSLEDAEKAREAVERTTAEYKEMIANAKKEAAEIIKKGAERAEKVREELIEKANEDARSVIEKTTKQLELERDKAVSELKEQAVNLSVSIAGKIITASLSNEQQIELARKALREMEMN